MVYTKKWQFGYILHLNKTVLFHFLIQLLSFSLQKQLNEGENVKYTWYFLGADPLGLK